MSRASLAVEEVTTKALDVLSSPASVRALPQVLETLQRVVGADAAGFYSHEWRGWTNPLHVAPEFAWTHIPFGRIPTRDAVAMHPGIRAGVSPAGDRPFAVTDVVSEREWLQSPIARMLRPDWGRQFQFAIPVTRHPGDATTWIWALVRAGSDFGEADREVAQSLAPVLSAIARHSRILDAAQVPRASNGILTQREIAVLRLQADGLDSRGIALHLGKSPRTAQKHSEHIYRKLDVHSRSEAVRASDSLGITPADR